MTEQIPPALLQVLRDIGMDSPDLAVPLHAKVVETLRRLGPGATRGQRIVALQYDFGWEHEEAGRTFARSKADYEHFMAKTKTRLLVEDPKLSVAKAETFAEADDEAYRLKLEYLLAEQRERSMRQFLNTLKADLDNHRTDRADKRAGDQAHADGYGGGA